MVKTIKNKKHANKKHAKKNNSKKVKRTALINPKQYLDDVQFLIKQEKYHIQIGDTSLIDTCNIETNMSGKSGAYILKCPKNKSKYIHKKWFPKKFTWKIDKDKNCIICSPMIIEYIANGVFKTWADKNNNRSLIAYAEGMRLSISQETIQSDLIMEKANFTFKKQNFVDLFALFKFFVSKQRSDNEFKKFDNMLASALKNYIKVYKELLNKYNFIHTDCKMQNIFIGGKEDKLILKISDLDKCCITIGNTTLVPAASLVDGLIGASRYHRSCDFNRKYGMIIDLKFLLADIYLVSKFYLKTHNNVISKLVKSLNVLTQNIYGKDSIYILTPELVSQPHIQYLGPPPYLFNGQLQLFVVSVLNKIPVK